MKPFSVMITGLANPHVPGYLSILEQNDYAQLAAIADIDPVRLKAVEERFKDRFPQVKYYSDYKEMYRRHGDVEVALIGSDNNRHCVETVDAAETGHQVYSMKVMSMVEDECRTMIEAVKRNKVKMQVELELHFNAHIVQLRKELLAGKIGKVKAIYFSNISQSPINYYPNWGTPELIYGSRVPIRPGETKVFRGGAITDHPHPFDLARWLTESEFAKVFAQSARNMRDHLEVEDHAAISAVMTNGVKVFINPSYAHLEEHVATRRLCWPKSLECMIRAVGEKGVLQCDYWQKPIQWLGDKLQSPNRLLWDMADQAPNFGLGRFESFYLSVRRGRPIESTPEDGLANVKAMNAAYESISHNREVEVL